MTLMTITDRFGGRSTFFAVIFLLCGIILAFIGKLTMTYVTLATGVQGLIVARAVGDDYHERNSGDK